MVKKNERRLKSIMVKIAVLGGGSLGLLLTGKLAASGCDTVLWTRTREQASLLTSNGLKLEEKSGETAIISVNAIAFEDVSANESRLVFLAVKQTALTLEFLNELALAVPIGSTLVLYQNGIGHSELLRHALPGRTLIIAVTTEGALRLDATTVRHTGVGETRLGEEHMEFEAETAERRESDRESFSNELLLTERLLKQGGFSVFLSKWLGEAILRKLLINAVINPLTALLRIRNGELTETAPRMELMKSLFRESFEILSHYGLAGETELWDQVLQVCSATSRNESSMLQDVSSLKETEIEFINGAICRMAIRQGREAPWNEAVTALVKATH
jgi:2-dehydropantoate 2-reductase